MRDFFHSRLFVFIVVILVISSVLLTLSAANSGFMSPVSNAVGVILSPLQKAASSVSGMFSHLRGYLYEFDTLKTENEQLRNRVSELEEQLRSAQLSEKENESFRELLGIKQKSSDLEFVPGEVIAVSTGSWGTDYTIDKGERDGIEMYDCVITSQGMVGYVTEVGATFSRITTVISTDMECGAVVARSREIAVAEGSFDIMEDGRLKLSYLRKDADVMTGDAVETSGLGGIFPKGLLIGFVERIASEPHGISNYAVIKPAVDLNAIKKVFVITDFSITD